MKFYKYDIIETYTLLQIKSELNRISVNYWEPFGEIQYLNGRYILLIRQLIKLGEKNENY